MRDSMYSKLSALTGDPLVYRNWMPQTKHLQMISYSIICLEIDYQFKNKKDMSGSNEFLIKRLEEEIEFKNKLKKQHKRRDKMEKELNEIESITESIKSQTLNKVESAMSEATAVLAYIKKKNPELFQEALDAARGNYG